MTASSAAPVSPHRDPGLPGARISEELDARGRLLRGLIHAGQGAAPLPVQPAQPPAAPGASAMDDTAGVAPADTGSAGMHGYHRLQRRMLLATVIVSALAVPLTALLVGLSTALNVLVGALAGLLYLRLLARSVTRLGEQSRSLEKTQLLVPIVLVLAAARIPQLEILPAFLGFLLYKPAVILQALLDRSGDA